MRHTERYPFCLPHEYLNGTITKDAAHDKQTNIPQRKAARRRESGDMMKRLIEEEEERKRLRKAEEEAERIAQEKARQEMDERHRRELEERRRALAKKRAEVEEKNRQLEVTHDVFGVLGVHGRNRRHTVVRAVHSARRLPVCGGGTILQCNRQHVTHRLTVTT